MTKWGTGGQIVPLVIVLLSGGISIWLWKIRVRTVSALLAILCVIQIYDQIAGAFNEHMRLQSEDREKDDQ
jgi:presenilin-like A22 family membrane protease